jgi:sporulation protein YlmC with PRC-barrel domain
MSRRIDQFALACTLGSLLSVASACAGAATVPAAASAASVPSVTGTLTPAERHDWERTHRTSRIISSEVRTKTGERIGDIRDLVLDGSGRVRLAIVSTGGFLGVGDTLHAVPWEVMTLGPKDDRILDIDKAALEQAPHFTSKTWPDLGDEAWLAENRRHYAH